MPLRLRASANGQPASVSRIRLRPRPPTDPADPAAPMSNPDCNYGCTIDPECSRTFTNADNWLMHEALAHPRLADTYLCTEPILEPRSSWGSGWGSSLVISPRPGIAPLAPLPPDAERICGISFRHPDVFNDHLHYDHGILDVWNSDAASQMLGPLRSRAFWCGFCAQVVRVEDEDEAAAVAAAAQESAPLRWWRLRMAHIGAHFRGLGPGVGSAGVRTHWLWMPVMVAHFLVVGNDDDDDDDDDDNDDDDDDDDDAAMGNGTGGQEIIDSVEAEEGGDIVEILVVEESEESE